MPAIKAGYKDTGSFAVISVFKLPSGVTEVKAFGPFSYMEKALSEKRKLLSNNSLLAGQVLRKQAQVYVLPMFVWTARNDI